VAAISKLTGASVHAIFVNQAEQYPGLAAEALTNGQVAYLVAASGKYGLADANASGKEQVRGIVIDAAGANQGTTILFRGHVGGYDLSGLDYGDLVYLSDTAGGLDDAASATLTVVIGRVVPMSDKDLTKVLYVDSSITANWA
jgi:hypothetical protein